MRSSIRVRTIKQCQAPTSRAEAKLDKAKPFTVWFGEVRRLHTTLGPGPE